MNLKRSRLLFSCWLFIKKSNSHLFNQRHLLQIASIHCLYHERLIVLWTRLLLFFFFIMREIKKILIKEPSHQRISSLNHFPFIHVGYMPTSVHKLICSLFYVHLTLLHIFKDKNLNRLENELEIRNCIEKALAYSYLFSCIFASGLS